MPQTVLITLTSAGPLTGPFDLYCVDINGNVIGSAFEQNVPKSSLIAGYYSNLVPDACTRIRVQSDNNDCSNYVDLDIVEPTTTTTSTSTTSTTSTSTSTTTSTTTEELTTTTTTIACEPFSLTNDGLALNDYEYYDCSNQQIASTLEVGECIDIFAQPGTITVGSGIIISTDPCPTTTTTTER